MLGWCAFSSFSAGWGWLVFCLLIDKCIDYKAIWLLTSTYDLFVCIVVINRIRFINNLSFFIFTAVILFADWRMFKVVIRHSLVFLFCYANLSVFGFLRYNISFLQFLLSHMVYRLGYLHLAREHIFRLKFIPRPVYLRVLQKGIKSYNSKNLLISILWLVEANSAIIIF